MAKCKYANLVGETFNGVKILNYKRVPHISKTGREYKVGRLTVAFETDTSKTLEISTDSWRKWSFIKRLTKLVGKIVKHVKQTFALVLSKQQHTEHTEHTTNPTQTVSIEQLHTTYKIRELKAMYRKLSKIYHPDTVTGNSETFKLINTIYRKRKYSINSVTEMFNEFNWWGEFDFNEEVDDFVESADWNTLFSEGRA